MSYRYAIACGVDPDDMSQDIRSVMEINRGSKGNAPPERVGILTHLEISRWLRHRMLSCCVRQVR